MKSRSAKHLHTNSDVGVYDCEVRLRFRLIEEKQALGDRDHLLEMLLDAFVCGADDYLEPVEVEVDAQEISEVDASPEMRRQLIRLRNSSDLA
ncbi:MAG: Npun_R1517 family heterocyst differentiation transcriptional regulator [Kaiparowitsia implicata GSE-PSE-MK54-09C]|jgi:Mg2+ and Co2+ transporter CorA|nr:Npun_R1517 family heterocyst differentiation transcriptional regulator [Kaiparowitsia implicata GSE-PSE-MK54-09C]